MTARTFRKTLASVVLCAAASIAVERTSWAQAAPPPSQDGNAAVKLAQEGRVAFDAARWDEAYDLFAKAQAAASSPVFQLYMARSRRNAKRLLEARALYLQITRREIAADAPPSWQQALVDARGELGVLIGQIPSILVDLTGAPTGTTARVDARPVRPGETVDVDPGEHVIVSAFGGRTEERRVEVAVGQRGVRVVLGPGGGTTPAPTSDDEAPASGAKRGSIVPGVIGLAAGGALLATGGIFGVLALGADGDASSTCPEGRCANATDLATAGDDRSRAGTFADVSTVMLIAGSVVTTAGVVLFVVRPGGGSSDDVAVQLRPGGLAIAGAL